jgi:hypothetical protein
MRFSRDKMILESTRALPALLGLWMVAAACGRAPDQNGETAAGAEAPGQAQEQKLRSQLQFRLAQMKTTASEQRLEALGFGSREELAESRVIRGIPVTYYDLEEAKRTGMPGEYDVQEGFRGLGEFLFPIESPKGAHAAFVESAHAAESRPDEVGGEYIGKVVGLIDTSSKKFGTRPERFTILRIFGASLDRVDVLAHISDTGVTAVPYYSIPGTDLEEGKFYPLAEVVAKVGKLNE